MAQDPSRMEIPDLLALCARLEAALAGQGAALYGVPASLAANVGTCAQYLEDSTAATEATRTTYLATKAGRDANRKVCAATVSAVARAIYASTTNTPAMIVAAGLRPRSTTRTKVVPVTPTKLFATPLPSGDVALEWARTGNAPGVNFVVEARSSGGEWLFVGDTTATRYAVSGYAPGEPVEFRVSASKNKVTSTASASATVFPAQASATPALRLAA